ncbi:hypothetical protein FOXG_19716 [Fusarium oxysporum f. sp. lycopersici 4287]|uniref:Uncharacterized protein n=1 Tax=Fusarium oxysporum f. sp. lycopersici (strain 4287 / CBS 123668 / FGSC 9935 / NRRL 34936) TaxID=426428 RepID=A0A0J9V4W8_FUSO4|nr:hypothetical protein FOXG_19311 [Fusarium oxysporum f. sp. lycopersici 4287]XP_018242679.1 hypothetical protein FOXG_19350 [Fusarium oxysporum f. sp. lycopersici 4287]XP_018244614.1 hypothetical protein FOXG_19716 [Fusarium oxysporum f. sp. lycopersici 4287]KNB04472.1 hypothetical protein FOXG_19311 [Fusarium oxysporum f. sp. lycopersici 4287]KNB04634.1 hypothetical protein FOXG_19350 [Fusarium oxysporum f. sp. lycopersici 4287]KNB06569.1 hypothetical protein FOXG_19716 [Fusarium oxysporum 
MSKTYGDAFLYDVKSKVVTLLTDYPHGGYLRVQYLPNGDYLLVGSSTFTDFNSTRYGEQEMFILKKNSQEPIPLGQKILEGVAISRKQIRIAWAISNKNYPELLKPGESLIYTADIEYVTIQDHLVGAPT